MKKPTMIIGILLLVLFIVPMASASDNIDNLTTTLVDSQAVIQTEDALNSQDNIFNDDLALSDENIDNDNLTASDNSEMSSNDFNDKLTEADGSGSSLSDLQILINNHINDGTPLSLDKDYKYDPDTDSGLTNGVVINGPITINGNGYTIDADNQARIFNLKGSNSKIVLDDINFVNGHANSGGAIYQGDKTSMDVTIKNCNFNDNEATSDSGGAVYLKTTGHIVIENNNFDSNTASKGAGALFLDSYAESFKNNNFTNNVAESGNAGAVQLAANTVVESCNFINNSAKSEGGAIYSGGNNIKIINSEFTNNDAQTRGGAVSTGDNTEINDSIFKDNTVEVYGGAVSIGANSKVNNSKFVNNTAGTSGGAVNVKKDKSGTITNSEFIGNSATVEGGAVKAGSSTITGSTFKNNKVDEKNGGAVLIGANSVISDSNFENNTSPQNGGAVSLGANSKVEDSTFKDNTANNGGAVHASSDLTVSGSKFDNNNASNFGGAIFTKNIDIKDSEFNDNNAGKTGGSLKIDGTAVVNNVTAKGGSAGTHGGFLWTSTQTATVNNLTVIGSKSTLSGGGAYFTGNVQMADSKFYNNTATDTPERSEGGAIHFGIGGDSSGTTIKNSIFIDNKSYRGSAIFAEKPFDIIDTVILDNQATLNKLLVKDTYPDNNHAKIDVTFVGRDNLINGIWTTIDSYNLDNVEYLEKHNEPNDDKKSPNDIYQNVTIEVYDENNNLVDTITAKTDENGVAHFDIDLNNAQQAAFKIYHKEDKYYTYGVVTLHRNMSKVTCESENITYPETEHLKFKVTGDGKTTPTGNVTVNLTSNQKGFENQTYTVPIDDDGFAYLNVSGLDVNKYNVSVRYNGDKNYMPAYNDTDFTVSKAKSNVTVTVDDITYGENAVVNVNLTYDDGTPITGKVNVTIKDKDGNPVKIDGKDYITVDVKDGIGTKEVPGLDAGNYTAYAKFENDNFYPSSDDDPFEVSKKDTSLKVSVKDIYVGDKAVIEVEISPEIAEGTVTIAVDYKSYNATIKDGKATLEIPGLSAGKKTVNVTFPGNKNYNSCSGSDEFTVSKIKPDMDTSSPTIKKGSVGKITVTVPKDATGKVTVEIEGKNYTADVKDGKAVFNIPGLSEGKHNFKAYYSGDDKYYPSEIDGCIEVIENSTHDSDDNKTSEKHDQDKVNDSVKENNSVKMNNPVKMHPTGNPMLMLLFALIILGTYPLRKFRK